MKHRMVTRRCTKATRVNGIDMQENQTVLVDVLSLHYDPAYWGDVDPNVFYPLRYSLLNSNHLGSRR